MQEPWKKLNLKAAERIYVLNAPESFEADLAKLDGVEVLRKVGKKDRVTFAIAFVTTIKQIEAAAAALTPAADGDPILWLAYPKGTSKRYRCEFNRDHGWDPLNKAGFEGMRMVAIDEDWSAVRFRRREFIKRS